MLLGKAVYTRVRVSSPPLQLASCELTSRFSAVLGI